MKIRVLGAGWYGCHIGLSLLKDGHDVEIHEISDRLFSGASGNIPARLHCGSHYPRSKLTRDACKEHYNEFMEHYGHLTSHVPINIYAIAEYDSLVDFGTYKQILTYDIPFIPIFGPGEFGLINVEGAILTGERHIHVDKARQYFWKELHKHVRLETSSYMYDGNEDFDFTIDCTFCAREEHNIDRFELCLTVLLEGSVDKAITIMDGPFPSLYPWDEEKGICSLTSAKWTPIGKYNTWNAAKSYLNCMNVDKEMKSRSENMVKQMSFFYPAISDYELIDNRLAIRAMPRSAADARLVDVITINDKTIRVRAGKIDAIFHAYREIKRMLPT